MRLDRLFVDLPLDELRPLLLGLARHLQGDLTETQVEEFCRELSALQEEEDLLLERTVLLDGEALPLVLDVLGHDTETFELVFIVPKVLALLVQEELRTACGVTTMRLISGEASHSGG